MMERLNWTGGIGMATCSPRRAGETVESGSRVGKLGAGSTVNFW